MSRNYITRERGLLARADGGVPSATTKALFVPPNVENDGLIGRTIFQLALGYGRIQNRTGTTAPVGFAARADRSQWQAGQVTAAGVYADDTTDAQDTGTDDFPLSTTGDGDGFLVACRQPINLISVLVSTIVVGSPVWAVEYSQSAGSWGTLTNLLSSAGFTSAAEKLIWWMTPPDLAVMVAGHGANVPVGLYGFRVRATTAPTTAPLATSLSLFEVVQAKASLANGSDFEFAPSRSEHLFKVGADSLYGIVDDVTALNSVAHADVRVV